LDRLNLGYISHSYLLTLEQLEDKILEAAKVPRPEASGWEEFAAWACARLPQVCDDAQSRLEKYFQEFEYEAGDVVQRENAQANAFYWVMSGEFHIFVQVPAKGADAAVPVWWSPSVTRARSRRLASKDHVHGMASLYGKLTQGNIAGGEVFCQEVDCTLGLVDLDGAREPVIRPMLAYTSIQCKRPGTLIRLTREGFARLREEDPQLCVSLLLAVASRREAQLRSHMLYRVEPEQVEVVDGARRRFTMPTSSDRIQELIRNIRYDPMHNVALLAEQVFSSLKYRAIRMQDRRPSAHLMHSAALLSFPH